MYEISLIGLFQECTFHIEDDIGYCNWTSKGSAYRGYRISKELKMFKNRISKRFEIFLRSVYGIYPRGTEDISSGYQRGSFFIFSLQGVMPIWIPY